MNSAQPIDEAQKSPESAPIVLMKNNDEAKSPWNVLLLLVVFTTGGTVILYYIRKFFCFKLLFNLKKIYPLLMHTLPEENKFFLIKQNFALMKTKLYFN